MWRTSASTQWRSSPQRSLHLVLGTAALAHTVLRAGRRSKALEEIVALRDSISNYEVPQYLEEFEAAKGEESLLIGSGVSSAVHRHAPKLARSLAMCYLQSTSTSSKSMSRLWSWHALGRQRSLPCLEAVCMQGFAACVATAKRIQCMSWLVALQEEAMNHARKQAELAHIEREARSRLQVAHPVYPRGCSLGSAGDLGAALARGCGPRPAARGQPQPTQADHAQGFHQGW